MEWAVESVLMENFNVRLSASAVAIAMSVGHE